MSSHLQNRLTEAHWSHLLEEGFSEQNIGWLESIGVRSITESEARSLNIICKDDFGESRSSSGIYFPFTKDFGQLRCDNPPIRNGKPAKYLTSCGKQSEAFLPENCEVVTEGFKDAAAGTLHGEIPTGALAGVSHCYKALKPGTGRTLLYDADGWTNPAVFTQLFKGGLYLKGKIQLIPEIAGQPKAGLCEYFKAGHTAEDYRSLINAAFEPKDFLIEIPKHWRNLSEPQKQKCGDRLLRLAISYLSKPETDQLIQAICAIGGEVAQELVTEIAQATINKYRKENQIEQLARLPGGYLWAEIARDKTFFDYLSLIQRFGTRLRFNALKKQIELESKPFQVGAAKTQLNIQYGFRAKSTNVTFSEVFLLAATRNTYSPIVEYLDRVSAEFGNNTEILGSLAERYFGQSEPIYNSMIKRFLIAAVARAYEPGCKVDTALILQGKQGAGKSTFFKLLAGGAQYFDDSLGNVGDKDEKLKLHRVWFVEWAELETVFRRKDVAATKAFLSSSTDFVRPPYGRDTEEMQRSSVIVGTTNQDEFLSDSTGNRRFWVIPVLKDIDTELLKAERDRIWAAAVALYRAGEQWWLTDLEEIASAGIAEQFQTSDPWTELVLSYAGDREFVTTKEILDCPLQIETSRQDRAYEMRVAAILKKAGWEKSSKRIDRRQIRGWLKPELPVNQAEQSEPRNPKNPELPAWVVLNAIAIHKPTNQRFAISNVKKTRNSGLYRLLNEQGDKFPLSECEPELIAERLVS
jgi:predicted P-loop ATPase